MATTFHNGTIFTPTEVIERGAVVVSDEGEILYVGLLDDAPRSSGLRLDMRGRILVPGFIDIHVHGGGGITFGALDTMAQDLEGYSEWVTQHGVAGFLTTIAAPDAEKLIAIIEAYVGLFEKGVAGAEVLGIHLEGPYLNVEKKGAQNPAWIRNPLKDEVDAFLEAGKGWIRQVTMAPELPGADEAASIFRKAGVTVAMGHTSADYETARAALSGDWGHVTHTFNAQTGLHHRAPGVIGAILCSDEITVELIADLIHVHPGAMKILSRCVGIDRVVLITDAMAGAGLPDGLYHLMDFPITVKDDRAIQANGTLAGSVALLNKCVRNTHQRVGLPLHQAVQMATLNPARAMGFADRLGSITVGKSASLTVVDDDCNVYLTMVNGKVVYNNL